MADEIVSVLKREILSGARKRGSKLPTEKDLARAFGVSTPTVREAIRALAALGLVEVRHGSGTYVEPDTDFIIADSFCTLFQLEGVGAEDGVALLRALNLYAAELAVQMASNEDCDRLAKAAEATSSAQDEAEAAETVVRFFEILADTTHHRLLSALIRYLLRFEVQFQLVSYKSAPRDYWRETAMKSLPLRRRMVHELRDRDLPALRRTLADYHDAILERIRESPEIRAASIADPELATSIALTLVARARASWTSS